MNRENNSNNNNNRTRKNNQDYAGNRQQRDSRPYREERDSRSYRDERNYRDNRDSRGERNYRENRDYKGNRDSRDYRENRDERGQRNQYTSRNRPQASFKGAYKGASQNRAPRFAKSLEQDAYPDFLPMSYTDMKARGWHELDILFISGDAYIDHPAFAMAILGRHLEAHGFRVGIITQPDWKDPQIVEKIQAMGRPRLFAAVSAGAVDSMLAHYTAFRKKRHDDAYTPGGDCGARPNRAVAVYTNILRQAFPHLPVVAGGIEASLRRLSHYDFWTDSLRKSIVADAKLDLVLYGMGERAILELAQKLKAFHTNHPELAWDGDIIRKSKNKKPWQEALMHIDGTARIIRNADIVDLPQELEILPSHNDIGRNPKLLVEATLMAEKHVHKGEHLLVQSVDADRAVLVERPAKPLTEEEMDALYALPYTRRAYPKYRKKNSTAHWGEIPAEKMMATSMTCHRGCGGGCSFCSLALHQGRHISSRSRESLLAEAKKIANQKNFDGSISDVGGPSANMWQAYCVVKMKCEYAPVFEGEPKKTFSCKRASCMTPNICAHFKIDQNEHLELLRDMKKIRNINHVRVASGVRFDLALTQKSALDGYAGEFTGGQLKVAPEHCSEEVLELMRKPTMDKFEVFLESFYGYCRKMQKEQYVVPYLLSAFPGCTDEHMKELATWLQERHWKPQQVQCFVPTPGTVASAMFFAECDSKGNPLFVAKSDAERLRQHGILMGTTVNI